MITACQIELMQRRLELMRALMEQLRASQAALTALDSNGLKQAVRAAESIGKDLRASESEMASEDAHASGESAGDVRHELARKLSQTRLHLQHLCRVQSALLRKGHRSITVMLNVLASLQDAYPFDPGVSLPAGV
jgi:hypothetical protein